MATFQFYLHQLLSIDKGWILLFVRVILGWVMVYYGYPKLKDLNKNAKDFVGMGYKPGWFWGGISMIVEFFGGIFILSGLLASFWAALFAIQMVLGTIYKIRSKKGFYEYSYDLQLLSICLIIIYFGSGNISLSF